MTLKLSTILSVFLYFHTIGISQSYLLDKVIATVGGEFILLSDLEDQFAYAKSQEPFLEEDTKCLILENLISQKIIINQAKLDSIEVSDVEVEAQLNYRFENILRQMNGDEEFFKEYYGASIDEMKARYREEQKQQILAERMQGQLINSVQVTPKEVQDYYESIPQDSFPFLNSEVEMSELVMKPDVNESQAKLAQEQLTAIRNSILNGEKTFEEMALKYSMDPGSAARGGDLGFAKRGTYVPEFEAMAFSLTKNEVSEVFESEYGFHIMKMLERRGNNVRVRHILIKPDITDEDFQICKDELNTVKKLIELDSITFEDAVKKYAYQKMESYNNSGRMKNNKTGNTFFETSDIEDPDIYLAIIDLKPNEISDIIQFKNATDETFFRIVKLLTITKPHRANLIQDYDKIKKYAKESKKVEYFQNWIREKEASTFVNIVPEYDQCHLSEKYKN